MTNTSNHIAIWIGIGIEIGIGKIFSSVLGIKSIGKKWYQSTFSHITGSQQNLFNSVLAASGLSILAEYGHLISSSP